VVEFRGSCLIIEAKASPPVEPFRDPDRAFTRLRHAFRADTGIQGAFLQANRLARRLRSGEIVELFDSTGAVAARLNPADYRAIYSVVFTRDDFGPLATNLQLLLEKDPGDPYPWVVNAFDFTTICEAREYWEWDPSVLLEYLDERLLLHGKAYATDELDFLGFRLRHTSFLTVLQAQADRIVLNPSYADVFDEMYRARHLNEPRVVIKTSIPVLTDLRRSLQSGHVVMAGPDMTNLYPRNRPCPCGKGKKYKRCCGAQSRQSS
jgi:hypothetical protein